MTSSDVWDTAPCSLVEVHRRFYETTRRSVPEGCYLRTRGRENLKSDTLIKSSPLNPRLKILRLRGRENLKSDTLIKSSP
jgi:hypothetical protein